LQLQKNLRCNSTCNRKKNSVATPLATEKKFSVTTLHATATKILSCNFTCNCKKKHCSVATNFVYYAQNKNRKAKGKKKISKTRDFIYHNEFLSTAYEIRYTVLVA
jgi:hypothetical protein